MGVLYILDEPSPSASPARQRAAHRHVGAPARSWGNTVVVVEHDEDIIRAADFVVDMGPGAGEPRRAIMA